VSERFDLGDTTLAGLRVLQRRPLRDERGYLERLFCTAELDPLLAGRRIAQINHTLTMRRGTVRGMHYQLAPFAETKFVSCVRGEVLDIAIDLRPASATFLQWHGERLSAENHRTLVIPEGFAHGFQTLCDDCEMLYFHTAAYAPAAERGLNPRDPALSIVWPLPITELSERDAAHPLITSGFSGVQA